VVVSHYKNRQSVKMLD